MELTPDDDFSGQLVEDKFADALNPIPTTPSLWALRRKLLVIEDVRMRQSTLGELCWLATVSGPDICARSTKFSA